MFSIKNEKKWIKITLLVIIILSFAVNLYVIFSYGDYFLLGSMEKLNNDDVRYIRTAHVLLDKGILVDLDVNTPTVSEMPGHAILLASLLKLFGDTGGITAFRVFQAVLQAFCVFLIFLICREVFNSRIGVLASFADVLYIPEISSVGLILTEIEFKFCLLLLVYISIFAVKTRQMKYYVSGGILWGFTCMFRPTIALFPAVILVMWLIYKYTFREILKYALSVVLIFSVIMAPWWIRNYIDFNQFIPLTLGSGNPLLLGTYIDYDQTKDFTHYSAQKDAIKTDEVETQTAKYRLKTYFKKYPWQYIRWYTIGKTWHLWRYPFYWKQVLGVSFMTVQQYHRLILLLGTFGMFLCALTKNRPSGFIVFTLLYFTAIHLPYFTFSRYAYPVASLFIILFAYSVYQIVSKALSYTSFNRKYAPSE